MLEKELAELAKTVIKLEEVMHDLMNEVDDNLNKEEK